MAGYTRAYNKSTGNTIEASDFNTEYQAIDDAFNSSTGHTHDGSTDEGAYVPLISDSGNKNSIELDAVNHEVDFNINVSGVKTRQIFLDDGSLTPDTDSDVDIGTTSLRFKDGYIDSLTVTDSITLEGSTLTVNGNNVVFDGGTLSTGLTVPNTGLHLLDTDASHDVIVKPGSNLTADRTLTITTGDADRTIDVSAGSVTFGAYANTINNVANEAAFKAAVNLEIGTDVQGYDAGLNDIAGLAVTDGNIIVGDGTNWVAESGATARTSLGLAIGTDVNAQMDTVSQAEAEAGTATTRRAWTSERVAQAIAAQATGAPQYISSVALSGASVSFSSLDSNTYNSYVLIIDSFSSTATSRLKIEVDDGTNSGTNDFFGTVTSANTLDAWIDILTNANVGTVLKAQGIDGSTTYTDFHIENTVTGELTEITISASAGNLDLGTAYLFGL